MRTAARIQLRARARRGYACARQTDTGPLCSSAQIASRLSTVSAADSSSASGRPCSSRWRRSHIPSPPSTRSRISLAELRWRGVCAACLTSRLFAVVFPLLPSGCSDRLDGLVRKTKKQPTAASDRQAQTSKGYWCLPSASSVHRVPGAAFGCCRVRRRSHRRPRSPMLLVTHRQWLACIH